MEHHDIETIELSIQEAQKAVDHAKQIEKLYKNRDFKAVIVNGLFEDEAKRLVHALSDPAVANNEKLKASVLGQMEMIANFRAYLTRCVQHGEVMAQEIVAHQNERDAIAAEMGEEA